jgi:hypothetical protein
VKDASGRPRDETEIHMSEAAVEIAGAIEEDEMERASGNRK